MNPRGRPVPKSIERHVLHEECGIVGAFSFSGADVAPLLYRALINLQHRGQDSAGMAVRCGNKIVLQRALGLVAGIFDEKSMDSLKGPMGIAHVRYPTIGAGGPEDAQPFCVSRPLNGIALGHNGNLANYGALRERMERKGSRFGSTCDADLILAIFADALVQTGMDIFGASAQVMRELDGAYSVCAISGAGDLIVFRDPKAIRPLCWGKTKEVIMFASESVALDINDIPLSGDVKPGECIIVNSGGISRKVVAPSTGRAHCMFEFVYFSRPDSVQEGALIYDVRMELGRRLAKTAPVKADIVVPVPDTSRPAAEGYAQVAGIPMVEGLIKNRYIGRTFIMSSQKKRADAVKLKLNAVRQLVAEKRIVLIDDSIVRGTTSGPIVRLLREAGAREIHLRIACPPVLSPCFYGVDLPTYRELAAANHPVEKIRQMSGADSLAYLSIPDLIASIGIPRGDLCLGCINGEYPTPLGERLAKLMKNKGFRDDVRVWEEKVI